MVNLKRLCKDWQESEGLSEYFNIQAFLATDVFLTKSGDVGSVIAFKGPDAECLESETRDQHVAACRSALKVFDERFVVQTFFIKRSHPPVEDIESSNPVFREAATNRNRLLEEKGDSLYSVRSYLVVLLQPPYKSPRMGDRVSAFVRRPARSLYQLLSVQGQVAAHGVELDSSIRILRNAVKSFLDQAADSLDAKLLRKDVAFAFFRETLNPNPAKASAVRLSNDAHVDFLAADSEQQSYRDHLRLDNYFIKALTVKQLPSRTFADMFVELGRVRADMMFVTEWRAIDSTSAAAMVRAKRRHWHNTKLSLLSQATTEPVSEREKLYDDSKEAFVGELGSCLTEMELNGVCLGDFSMTAIVYGESLEAAETAAAELMKVVGVHDGALNEERYNGLLAFLAALPGGYPYNLRRQLVTDLNCADMIAWFHPAQGERTNAFLGKDYLVALETEDDSLFHFNPHVEDVGHMCVVGPTGAGKSFLLNVFITHAQQYDPYTFIFDFGGSYRWLTEACGGSYVSMRSNQSPAINPFCLDPSKANLEFLSTFCAFLIESDGKELSGPEGRSLYEAIESIYVLGPEERRLQTLSTTLPRALGVRLKRWTEDEQYGRYFDNVEDTISLARFQCVDFEGLDGLVRDAAMFYFLHRSDEIVNDPKLNTVLKIAVVDEAKHLIEHPTMLRYVTNALRAWRKKNAMMILSTQSLADLASTEIRPVLDNCPTKLLLANSTLDADLYQDLLQLNSVEVEKLRGLQRKKQMLLKRDSMSKVLTLNVDPRSYWLFTTNPFEAKRRQELINQVGLEAALDALTGERK